MGRSGRGRCANEGAGGADAGGTAWPTTTWPEGSVTSTTLFDQPPPRHEPAIPPQGLVVASDIDVLLTTEGTYPFVTGGVSTWAHQLVTGLADKRYVVYSVVANTNMAVRYEPPPNLVHVVQVPLWG